MQEQIEENAKGLEEKASKQTVQRYNTNTAKSCNLSPAKTSITTAARNAMKREFPAWGLFKTVKATMKALMKVTIKAAMKTAHSGFEAK